MEKLEDCHNRNTKGMEVEKKVIEIKIKEGKEREDDMLFLKEQEYNPVPMFVSSLTQRFRPKLKKWSTTY